MSRLYRKLDRIHSSPFVDVLFPIDRWCVRANGFLTAKLWVPAGFDVERYFRDAPLMIVGEGSGECRQEDDRGPAARGGAG
jgi:hypothetical protein